ncbi:AAA family ATPase [Roseovarius sp. B08]|uniref:AAA family ATPase n=1 Tax=Roseovarius sp. B08 TaxID=3449223 RepID=UPI003EDBDC8C
MNFEDAQKILRKNCIHIDGKPNSASRQRKPKPNSAALDRDWWYEGDIGRDSEPKTRGIALFVSYLQIANGRIPMDGLKLTDGYIWLDRAVMRRLDKFGYLRMEDGFMSPTEKGEALITPYLAAKEPEQHGLTLALIPNTIDRWVLKLKTAFPNFQSFDPPCREFDESERAYKLATKRLIEESLRNQDAEARVADLVNALSDGNLLNWRVTAPLTPNGKADRNLTGPALLAMAEAASGPQEAHGTALARFVDSWCEAVPGNQRDSARQIGEFLLMHLSPAVGTYIRATVRDDLWQDAVGEKFPAPHNLAETYRLEQAFMRAVREAFTERGLAPRDFIDVQSALWVVHNYEVEDPMNENAIAATNDEGRPQTAINLILYGPPGTGKTYQTAAEALRLCQEPVPNKREDLIEAYHRLRAENRIEFVTFHQSMSYEEFIEGRQPTTEGTQEGSGSGFRLETVPGIFRRIAARAQKGTPPELDENALSLEGRQVFKMSIAQANDAAQNYLFGEAMNEGHTLLGWEDIDFTDEKFSDIQQILQACRDEGEVSLSSGQVAQMDTFRNQMEIGDIIVVTKGNSLFRAIGEITGDYEYRQRENRKYCHRRSVRWLWVDRTGVPASEIYDSKFTMRSIYPLDRARLDVAALESYLNSESGPISREAKPHVLIIDEINRANISKVFGELITLIEPDKRIGMPNALAARLPYSGEEFGVPANLHILGTMNTADRSIALLDTALRRRFEFREMLPEPEALRDAARECGLDLPRILTVLNERIEYLYDREHQIGHAYFINCTSREDVDAAMRHKVIPLLAEYFFEDWSKVAAVLGDASSDEQMLRGGFMIRDVLKVPPGMEDGDGAPRYRWSLCDGGFDYSGLGGE